MNLILVSKDDLREIIKEMIPAQDEKPVKEDTGFFSLNEAISYINNRGLKISKSSIYKKTAEKEVPFQRWGGKKIVFVRQELDEWIENQLSKRENGVIKTVADAARRKERV